MMTSATLLTSSRGYELIDSTLNPKFKKLGSTAQALWFFYLILKDHKTQEFYYSIDLIVEMTGHSTHTIISANNELEESGIMSSTKSHRKKTIYMLKEKIKLSKGETSFSLVSKTATNGFPKLQPTVAETATQSNDLSNDLILRTSSPNSGTSTVHSKEVAVVEKEEGDVSKSSQKEKHDPMEWINKIFGEEHCAKYPDDSKRKEILEIYRRGCCSLTIKNTILHWQQDIRAPSKLDEFVVNSLRQQMEKGRSFYD